MRKIQLLGLLVFASFAISVVAASAASAEVGLWTANGKEITSALNTTATGLLELTDLKATGGAVTVNCEGALDGYVEANGLTYISEVLYLGVKEPGNLIICSFVKAGLCEGTEANVEPIGLPWEDLLVLTSTGTGYVDEVVKVGGGSLGYMVTCKTILGETLDECTQAEATQEVKAVATGVEGVSKEENNGTCSIGGSKEGDIVGSGISTLVNGELLGVTMP
jgi:hypothetical protein